MTTRAAETATVAAAVAGYLSFVILALVVGTIVGGFVGSILWGWLVVPVFPGAPPITVPQAIGLAIVVRWFTTSVDTKKDEREQRPWKESLALAVGAPLSALLAGWIVKHWI